MSDYYEIKYSCSEELWNQKTPIDLVLEDILYGLTFRIFENKEKISHITKRYFHDHISDLGKFDGSRHWFSVKIPKNQLIHDPLPSIITQLWGNLLDYGSFRLESIDIRLMKELLPYRVPLPDSSGPDKMSQPFLATVLKPSYHLTLNQRIQIACEFVSLGGDFVKEDETYFTPFEKIQKETEAIQGTLNSIRGSRRGLGLYVPNITGIINEEHLLGKLKDNGMRAGMVNFLISGFQPVQKASQGILSDIFLWGHRVGFKCMENTISVFALIQLSIIAGMNAVHVGTPFFGKKNHRILAQKLSDNLRYLRKSFHVPFYPIFSKTTRNIIPDIIAIFGKKCILLGCGEFHKANDINYSSKRITDWIKSASSSADKE